jgi:exopolysaccharide biosynthesis polyprenyl glycosylphosphotransferase
MVRLFSLQFSVWKLVLAAGDALAFALAVLVGLMLNPKLGSEWPRFLGQHWPSFGLMGACYFLVFVIADLYDYQQDYRRLTHLAQVVAGIIAGTLAVIVLFYFPLGAFLGRTLLVLQTGVLLLLVTGWRALFSALALPTRLVRRIVIVGAGHSGRRILEALHRRPLSGLTPLGFVDDDPRKAGQVIDGLPVLGDSSRLPDLVQHQAVALVVVAVTHEKSPALLKILTTVCWGRCQILDMPGLYEFLAGKVPIEHISDVWLFLHSLTTSKRLYRRIKRLLDLGLAALALALTLPLFPFIALAIKLDSRGPVFFSQERLGQGGVPFRILKFRTMTAQAEAGGPQFAVAGDPRITRLGRILRRLRLDELPQLLNILKGDMSFVGPRPEQVQFIREFQEPCVELRPGRRAGDPPGCLVQCGFKEKLPFYSYRLAVKPGITGWAQVMYPYASTLEQTREKLQYDLYYIKNMGLLLDLLILLKTVRIVLFARGT